MKHNLRPFASTNSFPVNVISVSLVDEFRRLCIVGVPQGLPHGYPNFRGNGNGFNYGPKFPSAPNSNGNGVNGGNGVGIVTHQHIGEPFCGSE